jgi:ubiquinone/menaquinone biosynthesis C-methylase UbiE
MAKAVFFYLKLGWLLLSRRIVPKDLISKDYDSLAPTYDRYFSAHVKTHSIEMVRKLDVRNGSVALDLACGTGTITSELCLLAGPSGRVTAVDMSEAMLGQAKEKAGPGANVEFIRADMKEALKAMPGNNFDYVTCGWAIAYSEPAALIKMIGRVLKPGGKLGIIENRIDTLFPIRDTGIKVAQRYLRHIRYMMDLPFKLPVDAAHLDRMLREAGLKVSGAWQGEVEFIFGSGKEALDWALHTGASAGFDRIMDPGVRKECDEAFIEIIERDHMRDGKIKVCHKFVSGIAEKT